MDDKPTKAHKAQAAPGPERPKPLTERQLQRRNKAEMRHRLEQIAAKTVRQMLSDPDKIRKAPPPTDPSVVAAAIEARSEVDSQRGPYGRPGDTERMRSPTSDGRVEVGKFSLEQVEKAMHNALGNVSITATLLKCERQTIFDYIKRWPHLEKIRDGCRVEFADIAEGHLMIAARGGKEWAVKDTLRAFGKLVGFQPDGALAPVQSVNNNVQVVFVAPERHVHHTNGRNGSGE